MSLRDPLLAIHIAAGTSGLVLGPIAFRSSKRRGAHTRVGETYHWVMAAVCLSAAALAIVDWQRIWWFLPIATFSYANALVGYVAAKRRRPRWLRRHIAGMGGSYIALVTALLVVNTSADLPLAWFLPTLVGTPILLWVQNEVDHGRRPKRRPARPKLSQLPGQPG
jgi:peptidoglycan/LPS O-acetylase OafA/YrhL